MNNSTIKAKLKEIILEASAKNMWISHKYQGIILSPKQLEESNRKGENLVLQGWNLIPEESINNLLQRKIDVAKQALDVAQKALEEFHIEVELSHKYYEDENKNSTNLSVVKTDE